ncbi:MAG: GNAT family N-acetyltransferase [Acidobacteria bacterium]|nr:GNAT family N-acetyltransferase [Acidobacteriota bacterium]
MDSNGYVVRHANASDASALRAIRLESLVDTPDAYGSVYADVAKLSHARWRRMALESNFYLAERHDHVVGMASGGYNDAHPGTHWLFAMYVSPGARGSGVAAALVEAVSTWARRDQATPCSCMSPRASLALGPSTRSWDFATTESGFQWIEIRRYSC